MVHILPVLFLCVYLYILTTNEYTLYIASDLDFKKFNNISVSNVLNVLLLDDFNPLTLLLINDDYIIIYMGFPGGSDNKESACSAGFSGLIPESGKSPGAGNGYPVQYSCLENSMDRGAWGAKVYGVAKSWT